MRFSKELQEKINMLFPDEEEIRGKILEGDADKIND